MAVAAQTAQQEKQLVIRGSQAGQLLREAEGSVGTFQAVFIVAGKTLNGEYIPANVISDATQKFVGAKMYVDHPRTMADQMGRSVRDMAGMITAAEFVGSELRGTIKVSSTVDWLRTLISEGIAGDLSINVLAMVEWKDELLWVTSITEVLSVDFVTEGAAQGRVMEALNRTVAIGTTHTPPTPTPQSHMDLKELTLATLRAGRADLVQEIVTEATAAATEPLTKELNEAKSKIAVFEAKEKAATHAALISEALTASGIDAKLHESLRPALEPLETREAMDGVLKGIKESLASAVPASKGNPAAEDKQEAKVDTLVTEAIRDTFGVEATKDSEED